jgi:nitrite reductase/ring-hydroxylating ferredoxin subunit/uncharacterized membrane protein
VNEMLESSLGSLRDLPDKLADLGFLSRVSEPLRSAFTRRVPPGSPANTALAGTWLGHPLHPLLTDVVIGAWSSAVVLDWIGGRTGAKAADRLIAVGLLAAVPTAASGLNDWTTLGQAEQRVGTGHAAANSLAAGLWAASWWSRKRKRRIRGRFLALAGLATAGVGGFLGGDLSYRRGAGADQTSVYRGEQDWTAVAEEADLPEGARRVVHLGDMEVMLVRQGGALRALADRCAHQGGPLHEGEISEGCVTCPWHGSRFRLSDGAALSGPTAHRQPVLQLRVQGGKIELRREL